MSNCEHDKVYAPYALMTNPPQYPWVCRKCKRQGFDRGEYHDSSEYHRLIRELTGGKA